MKRIQHFINPIDRLGERNYTWTIPFIVMVVTSTLIEIYANTFTEDPSSVNLFSIFVFIILVTYFSFRDGIRGGLIITLIAVTYYLYLLDSRNYTGERLESSLITIALLGILKAALAVTIGGLRQKIDTLIEREADEKNRLQSIIEQLPVGVLITDSAGRITEGNQQIDSILGRNMDTNAVVGKDTVPEAKRNNKTVEPHEWPLAQTLATGKTISGKEFVIQRADHSTAYIQVNSSLIHSKSGRVIAAASIINDITERKEMEKRKDDFVNMASHELKTPITSMKLYIDTLNKKLQKEGDEKEIRMIANIRTQTERLQSLVSDLLDVSRVQTGKLSFNKETFRLDELVRETVDALQDTTRHVIELPSKLPPVKVAADRFRIYQVLTNLITNAAKYSPPEQAITVRIKRTDGKILVSVQDFGIGISKQNQTKIFDRLYQVTDPHEKTFPGLGMGLYISKEIIKRHRGKLWVESEKGKGSTFIFSLPTTKGK